MLVLLKLRSMRSLVCDQETGASHLMVFISISGLYHNQILTLQVYSASNKLLRNHFVSTSIEATFHCILCWHDGFVSRRFFSESG